MIPLGQPALLTEASSVHHADLVHMSLHDPDFVIPEEAAQMYWEANTRKVYRLLQHKDIKTSLKNTEVHILWPEDNKWYLAEVEKVRLAWRKADSTQADRWLQAAVLRRSMHQQHFGR